MNLQPRALENAFVRLEPFEDRHKEPLRLACDADPGLWPSLYYISLGGAHFDAGWDSLRTQQAQGLRIPFAAFRHGEVVGLSTYADIQVQNRSLEIGTTYLQPDARGGPVNPATKRLMLEHAFAAGANRVVFQIDQINNQSQASIKKLGAVREGVKRQDKITWTGRVRDSVVFSILAEEWTTVRERLDERLAGFSSSEQPEA